MTNMTNSRQPEVAAKKAYEPPVLTKYPNFAKITTQVMRTASGTDGTHES
jgi:hypothetical protein